MSFDTLHEHDGCDTEHATKHEMKALDHSSAEAELASRTLDTTDTTIFYMLLKKFSSRMAFLLATLALFVNSCRFSMLTKASSSGPVRSVDCSCRGIAAGIVLRRRSCLRSYLFRCCFVMPNKGQ